MRRASKYGSRAIKVDGHLFQSQAEAADYANLKLRERAGEIRDIELQPRFRIVINGVSAVIRSEGYPNGRPCTYVADFAWTEVATGERVVADRKGFDKSEARWKRAVVEALYGIRIQIIGAGAYKRTKKAPRKPVDIANILGAC